MLDDSEVRKKEFWNNTGEVIKLLETAFTTTSWLERRKKSSKTTASEPHSASCAVVR